MRFALSIVLVLGFTDARAEDPGARKGASDGEEARAALAMKLNRMAAEEFTIKAVDGGASSTLSLEPEPVLKWSNPVMGSIHGAVFLWSTKGRPRVIASVFKYFSPGRHMSVEFHSLSEGLIVAEREGKPVWTPSRGGVEPIPLPGALAPANSPTGRLRQMRALAGEFSAKHTDESGKSSELRLLTKPVYRYACTEAGLVDGGLFLFVEGTDPEVVLLVEARRDPQGAASWQYSLVRMSYMAIEVAHRGRRTWGVPLIPFGGKSKLYDRREPYTEFVFHPGQGVNPRTLPEAGAARR